MELVSNFSPSDASHGKPDSVEAVVHAETTFETARSAMEFTSVILLLPFHFCDYYDTC